MPPSQAEGAEGRWSARLRSTRKPPEPSVIQCQGPDGWCPPPVINGLYNFINYRYIKKNIINGTILWEDTIYTLIMALTKPARIFFELGVSINGGTPSHHPFLDGIFPELNHPAMGYNHPFWGTPINHLWNPPCINW